MKPHILGALAACLLLAACQSSSDPAAPPAAAVVPPLAAPAPASGPEAACIAKLAATASAPASGISVSSKEETVGGYLIMLDIAGGTTPWRCSVDDAGVATVESTAEPS